METVKLISLRVEVPGEYYLVKSNDYNEVRDKYDSLMSHINVLNHVSENKNDSELKRRVLKDVDDNKGEPGLMPLILEILRGVKDGEEKPEEPKTTIGGNKKHEKTRKKNKKIKK